MVGEPVLHPHRQCAAQGVETKDRVGADEVHAVDREVGDQIPIDSVAERLIESDPVHIDREALRVALQWGGEKTVVEEIGLKRIAGGGIERDARDILVERRNACG